MGFPSVAWTTVVRARHTDYVTRADSPARGLPIVTTIPPRVCSTDTGDFSARHIDYGDPNASPMLAVPWGCCDSFCPEDHPGSDCFVLPDCYPPGPGITRNVILYPLEPNCISERYPYVVLTYDDVSGTWKGSVTLTDGTINFEWSCDPGEPVGSGLKFILSWTSDCIAGGSGTLEGILECQEPLIVGYEMIDLSACCCVPAGGQNFSDFVVVANCKKTVAARHISYVVREGSSNIGMPVVAQDLNCRSMTPPICCQENPLPDTLHATATNKTGTCSCMPDSFDLACNRFSDGCYVSPPMTCLPTFCEEDREFVLCCIDNGDGTFSWSFDGTLVSQSCDPFVLVFDKTIDSGSGPGSYRVTITT